jgi:hypothetical protein
MNGDEHKEAHSPFLFSDYIYKWLDNALDYGITEFDFWTMTLAELERLLDSKRRVMKQKAQEQASYDYILADLIGRSVARIYGSTNNMPDISDVYPTLFNSQELEEKKAEKKADISAIRFRQFADSYNKRFKQEVKSND